MSTVNVSDTSFEKDVLKSDVPVVVDFWAEWCGPCKAMTPVLDAIAQERGDSVKIAKVNIDQNPGTPTDYRVRGIPTFIVFKGGEAVDVRVGGMSKSQFDDWLNSVL